MRVGILHSLSGSMALSEAPLQDAALMAIDEINQGGGVLGTVIEPIVADGASTPTRFAEKATALICQDHVVTLFGCWTSASRKAVLPIVAAHNTLLWYPLQYEGLEQSPHIFYTGSCLNQQVEPAVNWLLQHQGQRLYLVGSDYNFPRTANKLIRAQLSLVGGTVVGEDYVSMEAEDFRAIIDQIQATQPDAVFNTLNGSSNLHFYRQYQAAGITPAQIPIMAVSVAEGEVQRIGPAATGHYASWSYFQSVDLPANQRFVQNFQARYGGDRVTSDPIEAAYFQVYLWKQAVEAAGSFAGDRVRQAAYGQSFEAPGGLITLGANHHVAKPCRIGKTLPSGQFDIVFDTETLLPPLPWLGVETAGFDHAPVVVQILSEVSQWIQKAQDLETTLQQLQQEISERQRTEAILKERDAQLARTQAEIDLTRRLQTLLLPKDEELQQVVGLDIEGLMTPADRVGGDYYDVLCQGDLIYIGIGDVTGHSLESGMIMLMVQTAVRTLVAQGETDVVALLNVINQTVYANVRRMASHHNMTLMLLTYQDGQLTLGGQHETLILIRQGGALEQIDTFELGFPLGLEPDISAFAAKIQLQLEPGDAIVLYTDGISEAMDQAKQQYGLDRLCAVIQAHHQGTAGQIRAAILADLQRHMGAQPLQDDIALLIVKRC
ncbi:MAG: transporter substrate-binding protein [Leptolyngbya sp. RL_3_1]|nr:transporter substrate-binding protein [Leptolyngbya sp. RL_3_1]